MTARRLAALVLALAGLQALAAQAAAPLPDDVPDDAIVKPWTGVPDRSLVAWVDYQSTTSDQTAGGATPSGPTVPDVVDLTVLVVQTSTGRALQRVEHKKVFDSLALQFDHVDFDTADYALEPGRRAFGVRVFGRHLGYEAEDTTTLLLFEPDGAALRQVLRLEVQSHLATRDCGPGHDVARTVAVAPTATQGHADLVVRERREDVADGSAHPADCHPHPRRSARTVTLRFDGRRYGDLPR